MSLFSYKNQFIVFLMIQSNVRTWLCTKQNLKFETSCYQQNPQIRRKTKIKIIIQIRKKISTTFLNIIDNLYQIEDSEQRKKTPPEVALLWIFFFFGIFLVISFSPSALQELPVYMFSVFCSWLYYFKLLAVMIYFYVTCCKAWLNVLMQ